MTNPSISIFFLLLEYCKIRKYYAVANAFTIRNMYASLFLYMKCNSRKINHATKNMFVDLSRLKFTSDESEFIPDYI
jgi:hypothetical protein